MTRSAVVDGGEREGNRILHRYTTERMADSHEISPREVHGCVMCWAAEQKLHYAFGKQFGSGYKKDAVMDVTTGAGEYGNIVIPAQSPNSPSLSTAATP